MRGRATLTQRSSPLNNDRDLINMLATWFETHGHCYWRVYPGGSVVADAREGRSTAHAAARFSVPLSQGSVACGRDWRGAPAVPVANRA